MSAIAFVFVPKYSHDFYWERYGILSHCVLGTYFGIGGPLLRRAPPVPSRPPPLSSSSLSPPPSSPYCQSLIARGTGGNMYGENYGSNYRGIAAPTSEHSKSTQVALVPERPRRGFLEVNEERRGASSGRYRRFFDDGRQHTILR